MPRAILTITLDHCVLPPTFVCLEVERMKKIRGVSLRNVRSDCHNKRSALIHPRCHSSNVSSRVMGVIATGYYTRLTSNGLDIELILSWEGARSGQIQDTQVGV